MAPTAERMVDASIFEGLFGKGVVVTPALQARLVAVGYDPKRPEPRYPQTVFSSSIDAAAEVLYPDMPRAEAHRELGRRLTEGFSRTLLGSVMLAVLPRLSPATVVGRMPRWFAAVSSQSSTTVHETGPNERQLVMGAGNVPLPDVMCGVLERLVRGWTAIEVVDRTASETTFLIRWA
jgi:uncharacterized protein (TIGR02265 family)